MGLAAPEVLAGSSYDAKPVDIWSAGVMLYAMLFARFPFQRDEDFDLPDEEFKKRERLRIVKGKSFPQVVHLESSGAPAKYMACTFVNHNYCSFQL